MRGDVYELLYSNPPTAVVVLQDLPLHTWIVCPTSPYATQASWRPVAEINGSSARVLVEQLRAIDPMQLGEPVDRLDPNTMNEIDNALKIVLGLS